MATQNESSSNPPMFTFSVAPGVSAVSAQLPQRDRCSHCSKSAEELLPERLKRCAGCSLVLYCSKECQRTGWKAHKPFCNTGTAASAIPANFNVLSAIQSLGYPSLMAVMVARQKWARIHSLNLDFIANLAVYRLGGVDRTFASPKALVLHLSGRYCSGGPRPTDNPALPFAVCGVEILDKDSRLYLTGQSWDELVSDCELPALDPTDPPFPSGYAGILPVVALIQLGGPETAPIVSHMRANIWRTRCDGDDVDPSEDVCAALEDLMTMVSASIDVGHSYKVPRQPRNGPLRIAPEVMETVRVGNTWKQIPVKPWSWDLHMAHMLGQFPDHYRSGLRPTELWEFFGRLC
ncbi:hypothetical protein C8Q76DRAFT_171783 [Earliella scabrosa]|nr:hypothetical protein C8Q76DRAFT_171783 [Earliella scabrosa]